MPTFDLSDEDAEALVQYFRSLSNQKGTFSFFDRENVSRESYDKGKKLFGTRGSKNFDRSLKCGSCHPRGAELPEGKPADWGPDLFLANERLEPDWIENWLKNPQALQEGTKMPNFFYYYDEYEGEVEVTELLPDSEGKIMALRDYLMTMED